MPKFLLDTNVVSETRRPKPEPRVIEWPFDQPKDDLFLAAISLGELVRGVEKLPAGSHRQALQQWITHKITQDFKGRILAFDRSAAEIWGRLLGASDRIGQPRPALDAQIAATAISRGLILVTRNTADHAAMGAQIFNPWNDR